MIRALAWRHSRVQRAFRPETAVTLIIGIIQAIGVALALAVREIAPRVIGVARDMPSEPARIVALAQ